MKWKAILIDLVVKSKFGDLGGTLAMLGSSGLYTENSTFNLVMTGPRRGRSLAGSGGAGSLPLSLRVVPTWVRELMAVVLGEKKSWNRI